MEKSFFQGNQVDSERILYTPSVFAGANLIHLQETGTLTALKPHTSRRENLASYLFFIVKSGSGSLEYEGTVYPLAAGDCVFLDCRKAYSHRTEGDLWSLGWVHFYGPNMGAIYKKYVERGGSPCFRARDAAAYEEVLAQLRDIAGSGSYVRDMKICEKLTALLSLLMEEGWQPAGSVRGGANKRDLQDVKEYLDVHYRERISLDALAERFYINKFYLSRLFKSQFGVSASNYVLQARITRAKWMLRFSGLSVEEIGRECGMSDANYFSRIFKKVEQMTPGEFRRLWQAPGAEALRQDQGNTDCNSSDTRNLTAADGRHSHADTLSLEARRNGT